MTRGGLGARMSIAEALRAVTAALHDADVEEPRREARLMVAQALGSDLAGLIQREKQPLGEAVAAVLADLLARRAAREPLSRILGRREFYGLEFYLNAATLDPRPDTETLVEAVLAHLDARGLRGAPLRLLDIGTGTGAILLALLATLPAARGLGVDLAPDAVAMATANAARLGLGARAAFRQGDLMAGIEGCFEVIVSNPPYIPSGDLAGLEPEVRLHDPALALDGGADGLTFYRRLVAEAPARLAPGGLLAFEVGFGQAEAVAGLMAAGGFEAIRTARDLGGIDRVVAGTGGRAGLCKT